MRLLIISDTHGDISKVCKVVNEGEYVAILGPSGSGKLTS